MKKIIFILLLLGIVISLKSQNEVQKQILLDMSNQRHADYLKEKRFADSVATVKNYLIKGVTPDGRLTELQGFRNGMPVYYIRATNTALSTMLTPPPLQPQLTVEGAVVDCFRDVAHFDIRSIGKVGNGAGHFQNPIIRPR